MTRRTAALGVVAAAAVAAAVLVTVAGGKTSSPRHDVVAGYIDDVNAIERQMRLPLVSAMNAYRTFSTHGARTRPAELRLDRAEQTLRRLRVRLAALPAPPPAVHLRILLLHLVGGEVSLAHEVHGVAVFRPRFQSLLTNASVAGAALARALTAALAATAGAADRQADAIDAYDTKLATLLRRLRRLRPPAVMVPVYRTELRTLAASVRAGNGLAAALRTHDRSGIAELGRRFTLATRSVLSVRAQRAANAAIKAYDRRVLAIGATARRVRNEVARLQAAQS
jgi:hypothetical protein